MSRTRVQERFEQTDVVTTIAAPLRTRTYAHTAPQSYSSKQEEWKGAFKATVSTNPMDATDPRDEKNH